jgi:tetrahydromethanopterin S-methyltransferase subunit G
VSEDGQSEQLRALEKKVEYLTSAAVQLLGCATALQRAVSVQSTTLTRLADQDETRKALKEVGDRIDTAINLLERIVGKRTGNG